MNSTLNTIISDDEIAFIEKMIMPMDRLPLDKLVSL